ncbi:EVE domain-containing protein [soil metagenome]
MAQQKSSKRAEKIMNYWLVKQEPEKYSFDDLITDGKTVWEGVRNYQARNNLREMKTGDKVLFYHSVSEKSVVGLAEVSKENFPDPTDEKWSAVEIKSLEKFAKPIVLDEIKKHKDLQNIALIKQSRLSVMPLTKKEFETITKLMVNGE